MEDEGNKKKVNGEQNLTPPTTTNVRPAIPSISTVPYKHHKSSTTFNDQHFHYWVWYRMGDKTILPIIFFYNIGTATLNSFTGLIFFSVTIF